MPKYTQEKIVKQVHEWPNGSRLYVEKNKAGGHTYWSDRIGGGVMVWDTCLTDEDEILMAIATENSIREKDKSNV